MIHASMHIRPAIHAEVDRLDAIALNAKAHWGYSVSQMAAWRASLLTDPKTIDSWPTLVADVQGDAVGFGQVNPECSPWALISLWVLPEHMGQGVGKALLQHLAHIAASAGVQTLHIDSDPNAERFYLGCGAVRIGTTAAPIQGKPSRVRPQLRLQTVAA